MSKGRLTKYLGELIACGVVEKKREMNGNLYGRNVYKVTHEAEVAEDMKRIFRSVENRAIENATVENRSVENLATNNNNTNNNSINNINVCSEPKKTPDPSGILLPLNNGSMYDVPLSKIEEWKAAFPAVDVEQELRKMITWLNSNPERKKTSRGVNRFINNWLSKEQDKGGRFRAGSSPKAATPEPTERPDYYKYLGNTPPSPDDPFQ